MHRPHPATSDSPTLRYAGQSDRLLAWWLLVGGLVGALVAATLLIEKITLLGDANFVPSCSINPILSCGSVMKTEQASAFGFPNPIIGVASFPVVAATGAALLAGGRLARWYWLALQAGVTFGIAFVAWLIFHSLYRIGALCPYCMVVWAVMIPTFVGVTLRNLAVGVFGRRAAAAPLTRALRGWAAAVILGAFVVVLAMIAVEFWSYWSTFL